MTDELDSLRKQYELDDLKINKFNALEEIISKHVNAIYGKRDECLVQLLIEYINGNKLTLCEQTNGRETRWWFEETSKMLNCDRQRKALEALWRLPVILVEDGKCAPVSRWTWQHYYDVWKSSTSLDDFIEKINEVKQND